MPAPDNRPQLLVAILDWGMGHATRTLPLIEHAMAQGWHVHVATKGTALKWLKSRLEDRNRLTFHVKPGMDMKYSKRSNLLTIAGQMPAFLAHVEHERRWTRNFVRVHGIQAIVSDNCYGASAPGIPSVLMTHQLQIPVPDMMKGVARRVVRSWAGDFDELWVPDNPPGHASMAGPLSDAAIHPHVHHLGALSRLAKHRLPDPSRRWAKVGMVSGLEPHRSLMEKGLRQWMADTDEPCLVIAGRPGEPDSQEGHITTWNDPNDRALAHALQEAGSVMCRSGYSSQLDLVALGVKAMLVPTPGQPEQELLGKHWQDAFGFSCLTQDQLLRGDVPESASGIMPASQANELALQRLSSWLHACLTFHPTPQEA